MRRDELNRSWYGHQQLLAGVPKRRVGFRGCVGLAILLRKPENDLAFGDRHFVPESALLWAVLQDFPRASCSLARRREVHWATLRRTSVRFGMPNLRPAGLLGGWNIRDLAPQDVRWRTSLLPDSGGLPQHLPAESLAAVFDGMNRRMTAWAFRSCPTWRKCWEHLQREVAPAADLPEGEDARLTAEPEVWMPRTYLGFPASFRDRLWEASTLEPLRKRPFLTRGFQQRFLDDLGADLPVRAPGMGRFLGMCRGKMDGLPVRRLHFHLNRIEGRRTIAVGRDFRLLLQPGQEVHADQIVGHDGFSLPEQWWQFSPTGRLNWLRRMLGSRRLAVLFRAWFERQLLDLKPGWVHLSSNLAALAAHGNAAEKELLWDVSPTLPYFVEACDAFLPPPLPWRSWHRFESRLPGEIRLDLTPPDSRLLPRWGDHRGQFQAARTEVIFHRRSA